MNKEEFIKQLKILNIPTEEEKLSQLEIYMDFLIEYNKHTNLTAIKTKEEIYLKHFYDSLTIVKSIDLKKYKTLADIGSGAGFPGMVLKIFYPHLHVRLIDSNNKKITFLKELIDKLKLEDIVAINIRSEEYAKKHLDEFDIVTARAVTNLTILTELCLPLVKIGGYFLPLKASLEEELPNAGDIIKILNGEIISVDEFYLPIINAQRTIVKIKKTAKTPPNYPRSFDKMKKSLKKAVK